MGLFDGLESLGFNKSELKGEDLFKKKEAVKKNLNNAQDKNAPKEKSKENPLDYLYAKELECPACNKSFINFVTRKSRLRLKDMELDMKPNYHIINANCYDIFTCPHCGYSALIPYFNRLTDKQREIVLERIKPSFNYKEYSIPLELGDAAERYKLTLYNAMAIGTKTGLKAIICLKTAWVYRDMEDKKNELLFLQNACIGLQEAYKSETFPIGAMDELTVMFLVGELSRRVGEFTNASKWISGVLVARNVRKQLKERALTSKDLIRAGITV